MTSGNSRAGDGVVGFEYDGSEYQLVFDMKAIAFFEREAEMSLIDALGELESVEQRGGAPKVSTLAYLMQAGMRRFHPEVSAERAFRMASDPQVQTALGASMQAAMPAADEGKSAEGNAARPATSRRTPAKRSTASSKPRSKRG